MCIPYKYERISPSYWYCFKDISLNKIDYIKIDMICQIFKDRSNIIHFSFLNSQDSWTLLCAIFFCIQSQRLAVFTIASILLQNHELCRWKEVCKRYFLVQHYQTKLYQSLCSEVLCWYDLINIKRYTSLGEDLRLN